MNCSKALLTATAAAILCVPAYADETEKLGKTEGEIRLEKMLEGRIAGEPQSCIRNFPTDDLTIIDGTALVYKVGGTLYVNIPRNAEDVDHWDTLVTRTSTSQLCRQDIVTTVDLPSGMYTGNIMLGDFVPYRRDES